MEIRNYIDYNNIKLLPPPNHGLRRSWADSSSALEIASLAEYNKKRAMRELESLIRHIDEIKYNKLIYKEYAIILSQIIKKNTNIGYHHTTMYKKAIIDYIMDINCTRFNTYY
tara:strand:+ start:360 stop:698 length:339 start_codon:yes stop_codon:yes gene_type:complete